MNCELSGKVALVTGSPDGFGGETARLLPAEGTRMIALRATASVAGSVLTRQGPLAGRYPAVAAMVILALVPYLALSAALQPLAPIIAGQLHMSLQAMSLTEGLGNAG